MKQKVPVFPESLSVNPALGSPIDPATESATFMSPSDDAPINILLVDDEPKNLTVLETVLADPRYRLVRAASADEALLSLIVEEFAVLILDIRMPGMTGFELAQMIKERKRTAHVPIIFLTAYYNEDQHVLEGYGSGAVDYLHKPVNPGILRSKVSVFAELHRRNREREAANHALLAEVAERRRVEEQLCALNNTLEQRVAERTSALQESEKRFRHLADSMPQMVWTARPDGLLDYYNARWYQFTGFKHEGSGQLTDWEPLLHREDAKHCYEAWSSAVKSGEPYHVECRLWDQGANRYCWHLGRALPVRDEVGHIVQWIGTCTDIDEQKRSEERLRNANQALEQFAFAASHDLQEPLRNIVILTQLLKERHQSRLDEEASKFLEIIVEGAQRMGHLVSDLLEYTQTGGLAGERATTVDVEKVFQQVLQNLDGAVQASGGEVTHDALPSVKGSDVHLQQLLQNLVGNALKYCKETEPPRVHVSALRQGSHWVFAVQDNGLGIAPEYQDQVFGIFKRLHAKGGKYSGTGIGLAICQRIVQQYGGRLWVESELGHGSTFRFTIPVAAGG
jgi:PAS domain S-box-containing protein